MYLKPKHNQLHWAPKQKYKQFPQNLNEACNIHSVQENIEHHLAYEQQKNISSIGKDAT